LKDRFDIIFIDSAPVLPTVDPMVLGAEADATILIIRAGRTPKEVVMRAKDALENVDIRIAGIIMNNFENVLPYYYSYKYYKGYYGEIKSGGSFGKGRKR